MADLASGADYYINKLAQQLTNQRNNLGTEKYYKGSIDAMGGIDKATQWTATLLARAGIQDLSEIKEVTETKPTYGLPSDIPFKLAEDGSPKIVRPESGGEFYEVVAGPNPEGGEYTQLVPVESIPKVQTGSNTYTKLINSRTGEQLKQGHDASYIYATTQNSYVDGKPDSDYTIGGSFAGGNTSLKLRMVNGMPVFYSTPGPSSSDFPKEFVGVALGMASLAFPGLGTAIGGAVTGALGIGASAAVNAAIGTGILSTIASGGDIKKGVITGLTSYVAPGIASEIGKAAGEIFDSAVGQKMMTSISSAAMRAAALGGNSEDIQKAVMGAATGEMFNVVTSQIPGFGDIKDPAIKASVSGAVQAALNTPGDLSKKAQAAMLQGSIAYGLSNLEIDGKKFSELSPAQQTVAKQILSTALSGQPLNDQALVKTALKAAESEVKSAIQRDSAPPNLAAYDASVGLTASGKGTPELATEPQNLAAYDASVGLTAPSAPEVTAEASVPGAAPSDTALTSSPDIVAANFNQPDSIDQLFRDVGFSRIPRELAGDTDVMGPRPSASIPSLSSGEVAPVDFGPQIPRSGQGIVLTGSNGETITLGPDGEILASDKPDGQTTELPQYAASSTSDVPAKDISISALPETMRPREGETVTDATYGPEGEIRVTMVGTRPDGTEYSYTAVQDPADNSVFYETASEVKSGQPGSTNISNSRPAVESNSNIGEAGTTEENIEAIVRELFAENPSLSKADVVDTVEELLKGLPDAPTLEEITKIVNEGTSDFATKSQIEGIVEKAIKDNPGLTKEQVTEIVGGHLDQLDIPSDIDITKIVNDSIAEADLAKKADVTDAISNALAGLDFADKQDVENAIDAALKANPSLTTTQVTDLVNTALKDNNVATDTDISKLAKNIADVQSEISGLGLDYADKLSKAVGDITDKVEEFAAAGATRDEALDAAIDKVASDLGLAKTDLLAQLGETETTLSDKIAEAGKTFTESLDVLQTNLNELIKTFEDAGLTRDEAIKQSIGDLADQLGDTEEGLLAKLGTTESNIKTQLESGLAGVTTQFGEELGDLKIELLDRIKVFEDAGLTRDQATQASISQLADDLNDTEENLLSKLGTTEGQLKSEIGGLETRLGTQIGDLQSQITGQGLEYATKLSTAVDTINDRMTEFEGLGATRDEALQAAIDSLADELGTTSQSLLDQLNLNKTELQDQIEKANLDYAKQVAGLTTDITGVKTGLETLGTKVGEQVGGLGTKVAGIEQTLAQQPGQWAKLFSDLQKGFGTQISGLQSQLARQNAAQQAAQEQARKEANAPKFETFYANIPGWKPFDLKEFSSEFYDQE